MPKLRYAVGRMELSARESRSDVYFEFSFSGLAGTSSGSHVKLRILINAFSARQGGGQTYLINLLQHRPAGSDIEIFLLAPPSLKLPDGIQGVSRLQTDFPVENPFLRALWEKFWLPVLLRRLKVDVFFCPGGTVGAQAPRSCKTVTMFRNMLPFDLKQRKKYPLGYDRLRNWLLNKSLLRSMLNADLVIFISEYAQSVIEKIAHGPLKKSVVIYHGINPSFRVQPGEKLPRPEWLPTTGYFLYVSTLDVYKAQIEVVQAYAILKNKRQTAEKLLLVGFENAWYGKKVREEIIRLGLENDVTVVGSIPYDQLPAVYQRAAINIYASETENCPNILLEALAAGRPIVSSNRQPMPEFGGDAVVYFDPSSPLELAEAIISVFDDPVRREQLSLNAYERSQLYDWQRSAQLTWNAIENLVAEDDLVLT